MKTSRGRGAAEAAAAALHDGASALEVTTDLLDEDKVDTGASSGGGSSAKRSGYLKRSASAEDGTPRPKKPYGAWRWS